MAAQFSTQAEIPEPDHALDIQRHRQLTAVLFMAVIGAEIAVGLATTAIVGSALLAITITLAAVVLRGQWLVAQEREQAKVEYAAERVQEVYRDPLTGLPNRAQLVEDLAREIARAERFKDQLTMAVVEIPQHQDLVGLWGQDTADVAVRHIADTLRRVTRVSDVFARVDESRFAVALVKCSLEAADNFAEHVRLAVNNRPLRTASRMSVPLYLDVHVATLDYKPGLYRGPLEFLSAAGGDVQVSDPAARRVLGTARSRDDVRGLRSQLIDRGRPAAEQRKQLWRAS